MDPISFNNQHVLVTGANGFLGKALILQLLQAGAMVAGLSRTHNNLEHSNFSFYQCDITNSEETVATVRDIKPSILFHLASYPDAKEGFEHVNRVLATNMNGSLNLLEGFQQAQGAIFVYGDSSKCYGNVGVPHREKQRELPTSSYAITKAAGWSLCLLYSRLYDFTTVSVRPTLIYGPGQGFNLFTFLVHSIQKNLSEINLAGGRQTRDPLYIDDAVNAFMKCARKDLNHRIVNIGGGNEYTVKQLAELVVQLCDHNMSVKCNNVAMRPTEIMRSYCDNIEANQFIGWQPQFSIEEGLKLTIEYLTSSSDL